MPTTNLLSLDKEDLSELSGVRNANATRRRLQKREPDELRTLLHESKKALRRVEDQLDAAREKVHERVQHILSRYGDDTGDVAPEEEARKVIRGKTSDPLNDALRTLERRAEEAEGGRAAVFRGRVKDVKRLIRELRDLQDKRGELRHRRHVATSLLKNWSAGRVDLGVDSDKGVAEATARAATDAQLRHLKTARTVLQSTPEIGTKADFQQACEAREEPGGSVRKRVQELGKDRLDAVHLPSRYTGFDGGFQRLVADLWADSLDR